MNSKNALLMLAAILLVVVFLFEGNSPIQAVADSNPDEIQQILGKGEAALGHSAGTSYAGPSRNAAAAQRNSSSFIDDEPVQFEDSEEPEINDSESSQSDIDPDALHSNLTPEDVQGKPFDPRIG
ncbi:MAG: hypothetical protein WAT93_05700 [Pontixanthobacter sp.]